MGSTRWEEGCDRCLLADVIILILLYADDVVLWSSLDANHLDTLHALCITWSLIMNLKKNEDYSVQHKPTDFIDISLSL